MMNMYEPEDFKKALFAVREENPVFEVERNNMATRSHSHSDGVWEDIDGNEYTDEEMAAGFWRPLTKVPRAELFKKSKFAVLQEKFYSLFAVRDEGDEEQPWLDNEGNRYTDEEIADPADGWEPVEYKIVSEDLRTEVQFFYYDSTPLGVW